MSREKESSWRWFFKVEIEVEDEIEVKDEAKIEVEDVLEFYK